MNNVSLYISHMDKNKLVLKVSDKLPLQNGQIHQYEDV